MALQALELNDGDEEHTFGLSEQQILVEVADDDYGYQHEVLLVKLGVGRFVTANGRGQVLVRDLSTCTVIPLEKDVEFPDEDRPFMIFDPEITDAELAVLRQRAHTLAVIHGGAAESSTTVAGAAWRYADIGSELFGTEVSGIKLHDPTRRELKTTAGLVREEDDEDGDQVWAFVELVKGTKVDEWLRSKRMGPGRHPLLSGVQSPSTRPALFTDASASFSDKVKPAFKPFAKGQVAIPAIIEGITESGLEPKAYANQYLQNSGINLKSSLAHEVTNIIWCLWLMSCSDGVNLFFSSAAEHLGRRYIQIQRAIQKSPRSPDFTMLDYYMGHTQAVAGVIQATEFDEMVTSKLRTDAQILKQARLAREEDVAETKRENAAGGGGGGGGGGPDKAKAKAKAKAAAG